MRFIPFLLIPVTLYSQVFYNKDPEWVSTNHKVGTGGCWSDINQDGWIDLVIANGNDIELNNLEVYYNKSGVLPTKPDWVSSDKDFHGHLDAADINKDGFPDIAVSVYIGKRGFSEPGKLKVYMNNNGKLSSFPSWISKVNFYTFSCAFGDPDNDGDPDIAVASGESYYNNPEYKMIFFNNEGKLDSLPGWKSKQKGYCLDVEFADIDNDGDHDLVFAEEGGSNSIFVNYGDSIETIPSWKSKDGILNANSIFLRDIDKNGFLDLAVSDNNQLGGTGRFKIYLNNYGNMDTIPFWTSDFSGFGSGITLADIDNDEDYDLITGGWWEPCRIFLNKNGMFDKKEDWLSNTNSVVEAIFLIDYDNDQVRNQTATFEGNRKIFYFPKSPIQQIFSVGTINKEISPKDYTFDLENGWISFRNLYSEPVYVSYQYSLDLDIAVTNWDRNTGNFVFENDLILPSVGHSDGINGFSISQNFPNPFNTQTRIDYSLKLPGYVLIEIFSVLGERISVPVNQKKQEGDYSYIFNGENLPDGIYLVRFMIDGGKTAGYAKTIKIVLLK